MMSEPGLCHLLVGISAGRDGANTYQDSQGDHAQCAMLIEAWGMGAGIREGGTPPGARVTKRPGSV